MDRLVSFAVERRFLMVGLFAAVVIGGLIAFRALNIEAYPDPTPPMVDVVTQSPGLSAEEIERYITIPLEAQVAGLKNLNVIRTISLYGLSDVKLQFSFDFTYEQALQQVLNRLAQMAPLPNGALPQISPLSPIGEIYRYRLVGPPNYSVLDLKTLAGLDLAAPLPHRARRDRRHRLGRQDQDLRTAGRFQQAGGERADLAAAAAGDQQFQHQCRRQHRQYRSAGRGGARRRPDPLDRRARQHHDRRAERHAGAGQGRRRSHRRLAAAARHRRREPGRRYRPGHRADAARRAELADDRAGGGAGRAHQPFQHPAAGRAYRAHLRPQGPDRDHDQDRAREHGVRHRPDRAAAMDLPRRSPQRPDRRRDHSVRAVLCRQHPGAARRIRQSACRSARSISA